MTRTVDAASATAVGLALELGLAVERAELLHRGANISLRLVPTDVVARIVAEVGPARSLGGRPDAERELAVATFLAGRGAPVVAPTTDPPAGLHERDGMLISFRRFVVVRDQGWDHPVETGRTLREVHDALRSPGAPALPSLPVWRDTRGWIAAATFIHDSERGWLLDRYDQADAAIAALGLSEQALHGDAHPGNLLMTDDGPVWTDFEETGRWPVEWDLACLLNSGLVLDEELEQREAMIRAYGREPDDPLLYPFNVARTISAAAWIALTGDYRGAIALDRLRRRLEWLRSHP